MRPPGADPHPSLHTSAVFAFLSFFLPSYWVCAVQHTCPASDCFMRFVCLRPEVCLHFLSDSTSRWTPLASGWWLALADFAPTVDFHRQDTCHARHTKKASRRKLAGFRRRFSRVRAGCSIHRLQSLSRSRRTSLPACRPV
ncbi:hypothetical protein FYJ51_00540 [Erysipelotrichaceae bacterium Oil+RF-744-GAM-WT-6]|uniref:Uncharacterized protein n=1 Tax=Stecheria intestinalis TaxID=2606630 RepID=A0A7X2NQ16_9FIRM|nr:hypothetical protein [Stecheria intestinalis]